VLVCVGDGTTVLPVVGTRVGGSVPGVITTVGGTCVGGIGVKDGVIVGEGIGVAVLD
jgi:hypothetical protein